MKKFYIVAVVFILAFMVVVSDASAMIQKNLSIGLKADPQVQELQTTLINEGYLKGTANGSFGPKTQAAVIAFQKANGINPTGIVGPLTRAKLQDDVPDINAQGKKFIPSSDNSNSPAQLLPNSDTVVTSNFPNNTAKVGDKPIISWSASYEPTYCASTGSWSGQGKTNLGVYSGTNNNLPAFTTAGTFTYEMQCTNHSFTDLAGAGKKGSVTIVVTDPLVPTVTLTPASQTLTSAGSVALSWKASSDATSCSSSIISPGDTRTSGTNSVYVSQTSTYTVTCINALGKSGSSSSTITVAPSTQPAAILPPTATLTFSADTNSITSGQSATLSWNAVPASGTSLSCTGVGFNPNSNSGSAVVSPTQSTQYTINCMGSNGQGKSATVTIGVVPAPTTSAGSSGASTTTGPDVYSDGASGSPIDLYVQSNVNSYWSILCGGLNKVSGHGTHNATVHSADGSALCVLSPGKVAGYNFPPKIWNSATQYNGDGVTLLINSGQSGGTYMITYTPSPTSFLGATLNEANALDAVGDSNSVALQVATEVPTQILPIKKLTSNLSYGSQGDDVKVLQQFLIDQNKGPNARVLKAHGVDVNFGNLTRSALYEWQKSAGMTPTGYFGLTTRAYIEKL